MRILIVDDSAALCLTLSALLEDDGHVVTTAESLASARRLLPTAASFDLVVLDVHLGDGFGPSLIPELRAAAPSVRIALLTGDPTGSHGADAVLVKGDDPFGLLDELERATRP